MSYVLSWVVFGLSIVPPLVGTLPVVGWLFSWAWAVALFLDSAVLLTPSQRWAVARLLAAAQPDTPLLVVHQWDGANAAGAWHNHKWGPEGVEASVVARLQQLHAMQSPINPNVFFWRKTADFVAAQRLLRGDPVFESVLGIPQGLAQALSIAVRPAVARTSTIVKAHGYEVFSDEDQFF